MGYIIEWFKVILKVGVGGDPSSPYHSDELLINYVEATTKNGEVGYNKNCEKTRITDLYFAKDLLFSPMGALNLNNFETII